LINPLELKKKINSLLIIPELLSSIQVEKILKTSLFIILSGFFVVLSVVFLKRFFYPFELNWTEQDIICTALRFARGEAVYINPAQDFVPHTYPPLYSWLISLFIPWLGSQFWVGRLISILSFLAVCFFIYRIVYYQTGDRFISLVSFLFLSACYDRLAFWFDLARVDSFFMALSLGGLYLLDKDAKKPGFWISAILLAAAFFTKQTAVFFIGAAILILWREDRRASFSFFFFLFTLIGIALLLLNHFSGGWYWFYTYEVPSRHTIYWVYGLKKCLAYTLGNLPVICGIVFYGLFLAARGGRIKKDAGHWAMVLPFVFIATVLPYAKWGGFINNLYPLFVFLCIIFGISLKQILNHAGPSQRFVASAIWVLLVFQSVLLLYNPLHAIPEKDDVKAGRKFIRELSQIEGEVYLPQHSFYGVMAGKKLYPSRLPAIFVKNSFPDIELLKPLKDKISRREFKAIYTDQFLNTRLSQEALYPIYHLIASHYRLEKILKYSPRDAFIPFSETRPRPGFKYTPKSDLITAEKPIKNTANSPGDREVFLGGEEN
jgi:4-amino-4-deoxy-L-arabinose transferase-like glycosyltransferase